MVVRHITARPKVTTWVQWTGDNLLEVNDVMQRELIVNDDGNLVLRIFNGTPIVATVGSWCSPDNLTSQTTEQLDVQQDVDGDGPFRYVVQDEDDLTSR